MTTPQHTAGPWSIANTGNGFRIQSDSGIICWEQKNGFDRRSKQEGEANGRLIAAAPDLLDALEELVERDRSEAAESGFTDDQMTWLTYARHAIAKAKKGGAA